MKKKAHFGGTGTALVCPMEKGGKIDWKAYGHLVESQIEASVDSVVVCGTTGESSTLRPEEHIEVIRRAVKMVNGRIPILAGTGSNAAAEAVMYTRAAKKAGADGALVVAPYYNKPTQAGIIDYYRQVSKVGLPVILYDIPGRCGGTGVSAETILRLADDDAIQGLKWASGNLNQLQDVLVGRPEGFTVLSGDDQLTYLAMCLGAEGVISVLANLLPIEMVKMVVAMNTGNHAFGKDRHYWLRAIMEAMFIETNPIPIKTALAMINPEVYQEVFRSPMVPMGTINREKLENVLMEYDLLPEPSCTDP